MWYYSGICLEKLKKTDLLIGAPAEIRTEHWPYKTYSISSIMKEKLVVLNTRTLYPVSQFRDTPTYAVIWT
jgi:hypothetical protein